MLVHHVRPAQMLPDSSDNGIVDACGYTAEHDQVTHSGRPVHGRYADRIEINVRKQVTGEEGPDGRTPALGTATGMAGK